MIKFWKQYNIPILLLTLTLSLSGLTFYNYYTQKNLLLEQMKDDAENVALSIIAAMDRFHDIKSTMSTQKLISDVSLGLEIFEFRYIEPDGMIQNSMFQEEIGQIYNGGHFKQTIDGALPLGKFFFEIRDYVPVMAIYYPVMINEKLAGIIDLAVDISEYKPVVNNKTADVTLIHRQTDIINLLKAIEGSINNSSLISSKTDLNDFLSHYIDTAKSIVQISLVDKKGKVVASSNKALVGEILKSGIFLSSLMEVNNHPIYRLVMPSVSILGEGNEHLLLLIDAAVYVKNENRLLTTASMTAGIAILFALFIAYAIYYSTINRSREEKERLEELVKDRTREIELLSKIDALTGLWNRGYLEEMMKMEFKRARRYKHDISILVIDLDFFKKINDTYGHLGGDEVLRSVSQRITECLRETDFVGRYGGEEIVVILAETSTELAVEIAENIRSAIAANPVYFIEETINVTASIGIAAMRSDHEKCSEIFSEADEALYSSKKGGRNQVTLYHS
ncbi:MAG: GGDEF domain-containing protein [Sulfuricurvum sp.]|nr:GGDEF domain-containing protein [Sulfuricurvum sp.]